MSTTSSSRPTLANMFTILRYGNCPALAGMKNLSEGNLKELANAVHISLSEPLSDFITANYDTKASWAEIVYIEEAYQLAQSGEVDQVNQMTDLQLRVVAYGKSIVPQQELYDRSSFQMRLLLLAKFAHRPDLEDGKIIFTKKNGVIMRF